MTRSAGPYLELIRRALTQIDLYQPSTEAEFLEEQIVQDAILMRLQEIGENLSRIRRIDNDAFNQLAPDSWHKFIGLRNIISHGYHEIDPEQIWEIVTIELPLFRESIQLADQESGLPVPLN